jgi:ABC-type antimicrobial peptide transport system permease subunit
MVTAVAGGVVGFGAALSLGGIMREFLFGITTTDPVTLVAVPAVLLAAVAIATIVPAVRATRISPALVLRGE